MTIANQSAKYRGSIHGGNESLPDGGQDGTKIRKLRRSPSRRRDSARPGVPVVVHVVCSHAGGFWGRGTSKQSNDREANGAPSPLDRGRWLASLRRCESNLLCRQCGLLPRCRRLLPARFRLSLLPTSPGPFRRGFLLGNLS